MRLLDRWREIFATLNRRKLRTALTALSVAWGIFMLVVLLAAGQGLANGAETAFRDDAANSVWLYATRTTKPYQGQPRGRRLRLSTDDYNLIEQGVPIADHVAARYHPRKDATARYKDRESPLPVRGVHAEHRFIERTTIERGRFINETDVTERRKVAVMGRKAADTLFPDGEDPIGAYVTFGKTTFRIVGLSSEEGEQREQETVYVPITTAQLVFGGNNRVDQVMFTVGNATVAETEAALTDVRRRLAQMHAYDPTDKGGIRIRNNHEMHQRMSRVLWAIRTFVWLIGLGTILAGVVGVGNIMLIAVKERTREFGIRKALGATPASIILMVIEEALVITTVSGYLGLVAAVALVEGISHLLPASDFFKNPEVNLGVGLAATGVLVIAGLLAGLWPARRAARVNPVEALRSEG